MIKLMFSHAVVSVVGVVTVACVVTPVGVVGI